MTDQRAVFGEGAEGAVTEAALIQTRELFRAVLDRPGYAFSDAEILANLRFVSGLTATLDAVKLMFVAELANRPGVVTGAPRGGGAVTFLTEALNQSRGQAVRDVAAAAALASSTPELPLMGQALADGAVCREHVDVAVATLRRIPKALKTKLLPGPDGAGDAAAGGRCRTGAEVIDEVLTGQARHLPPTTIERLGRQIVHRLDPDRAERFNADAHERRTCAISSDFAGMGLYRLILDPATNLEVRAAIARFAAPHPSGLAVTGDGEEVQVKDTRTLGQRQADAVVDLILTGAATHPTADPAEGENDGEREDDDGYRGSTPSEPAEPAAPVEPAEQSTSGAPDLEGTREREPEPSAFIPRPCTGVEILAIATLDQLAAAFGADDSAAATAGLARMGLAGQIGNYPGATIPSAVLARLACDAPIRRILLDEHGAVLHYGRSRRFASPAQKRALAARDGGCCIPGCHAPPEWSQAHHVIPWEEGGVTNIDTMVLLCGRHHTAHHAGIYDLQIRDGIPWVRLPAWQDPARTWLRNLTHGHPRLADATARTLTGAPSLPRDPWQAPGRAA